MRVAERQSLRAVARELEARLTSTTNRLEQQRIQAEAYNETVRALEAEVKALTEAYALVKPRPRARARKESK